MNLDTFNHKLLSLLLLTQLNEKLRHCLTLYGTIFHHHHYSLLLFHQNEGKKSYEMNIAMQKADHLTFKS